MVNVLSRLPETRSLGSELAGLRARLAASGTRIAVVDDDPTGTQTVRDVPLITSWGEAELRWAMATAAPTFGLLTNTRALPEESAVAINCEVGERLGAAARRLGVGLRVISRSDSTLRGHFPAEPEALAEGLRLAGEPVDGIVVCPAFPEAGRITVDDVHWLVQDDSLLPAAASEYAGDPTFGYRSSNLLAWVRERAGADATVASLSLEELRVGGPEGIARRLRALVAEARYVVANAAGSSDLEALALGIDAAEGEGLRLIARTGPSFLSASAGEPTARPLGTDEIAMPGGRGLVVVGSHTELTTTQLREARTRRPLPTVTVSVEELLSLDRHGPAIAAAVESVRGELACGVAALATSRDAIHDSPGLSSLEIAATVAGSLVEIVRQVAAAEELDWVVAKGGITSHDLAVKALGARRVTVLGQLFAGQISVWELGDGSLRPGLRYVVFPGNVGDRLALADTLDRLMDGS